MANKEPAPADTKAIAVKAKPVNNHLPPWNLPLRGDFLPLWLPDPFLLEFLAVTILTPN
ncbi:hypothetical protein [Synechocystis sp. LEGE 06083]|uniref:hypothetical protein n=1 Tax=Synechocystis sp. LEGE 06083 TaxID=915336 RepID=UPI001D13D0F0|nr:hypothetical protein [Synechocystis sp. LEGE 06083]